MEYKRKKTLIFLIILTLTAVAPRVSADFEVENIKDNRIENGFIKVSWITDKPTRWIVYYGLDPRNLNGRIEYTVYDYYHEASLGGLEENKTYYYKIISFDEYEDRVETFLRSFSTKGLKGKTDVIKPFFEKKGVLQVTDNAAAISWETNEETNAVIYYGSNPDKLNKKVSYRSYDKYHELLLYNLNFETPYSVKVVAKDKSGNQATGFLAFNTFRYPKTGPDLIVSDIKPVSFDEDIISSNSAVISWKTNFVSKSYIVYGDKPGGKYNNKVYVSESLRNDHSVELTGLETEKTYYYKIVAQGGLYKKKVTTSEMTFATKKFTKKLKNGSLVKGSGYKVYFINDNKKYWIETAEIFDKLGYKWSWIQTVSDQILAEYKEEKSISTSTSHPDGTLIKYSNSNTVYLIESRKKRPFSSAFSFLFKGYSWDRIITISTREKYRNGAYL